MADPTLDVVNLKLDNMLSMLQAQEERYRTVSEDHEKRLRLVEDSVIRLSERWTLWQSGQAVYTTIVGAIAALLGGR